jgi:hypothetical protein
VRFDATTVAALTTLTEALDEPGTDIVETVSRLGDVVAAAVPTFMALSFRTGSGDAQIDFTGRSDAHQGSSGIRTSLLIPLPDRGDDGFPAEPETALVLYAGRPGAFVDVAADISWLTGRPLDSFRIDEHLGPAGDEESPPLREGSTVNQAVGVLLDRGFTMEAAVRHLDGLAAAAGVARVAAAAELLDQLSGGEQSGREALEAGRGWGEPGAYE